MVLQALWLNGGGTNDSFPATEPIPTGIANGSYGANWAVGGDKAERRLSDSKSGRCPWGLLRQALSSKTPFVAAGN
jgi:hypothetical protein